MGLLYNTPMSFRSLLDRPPIRAVTKHWLSVAFILGFATDLILLNQIDSLFDNLVLGFYATLATVSLLLFYLGVARRGPERLALRLEHYMPVAMQYSFGGLLSGMLIFYGRSGDFFVSAPFLLLIVAVVFGNELIHKRSNRLLFHLSLYFIGILAYFVLLLPLIIGMMGDVVFVLSGLLACLLVYGVIKLLLKIIPNFVTLHIRMVVFVLGSIYATFNILYFLNIIPPIPLSLTELHIYHDVTPIPTGGYRILTVDGAWWKQLPYLPQTFSPVDGKGVSCFARVYVPSTIATDIYHRWEYYDETAGAWTPHYRMSYPVSNQNRNGYGGYSQVVNGLRSGEWRCSVETKRGQVLGRRTFTVDMTKNPGTLVTKIE